MLRGPGFLGKRRGKYIDEFSMQNFNIPIPSLDRLYKDQSSYTTKSGIYKPFLQAAHQMAVKYVDENRLLRMKDNESVAAVPVVFSTDGMLLKPGCQRDPVSNELIGTTENIDINYIRQHPKPDPATLKKILVCEADVGVITTLDNKITVPVSLNFLASGYTFEDLKEKVFQQTEEIQLCAGCFPVIPYPAGVVDKVPQGICHSRCERCE
jgi:hypothetical protein